MRKRGKMLIVGLLGLLMCGCSVENPSGDLGESLQKETEVAVSVEAEAAKPKEFSLAYVAQGGLSYEDAETFTGGKIHLNVYSGGALGTEKEMIQGMQAGTISIMACTPAVMTEFIPELAVLDIPGMYADMEECNRVLQEDLFDWIQSYYNQAGLQLISWGCTGFRQVTSNRRIEGTEDFRGLKLRVMENIYHEAFWSDLGTYTTAMDFDKLPYALQKGEVEAQENILSSSVNGGIMEYQKYLIITNHIPYITSYVMNKEIYDSLTSEEQEILTVYLQGKFQEAIDGKDERERVLLDTCRTKYGVEIIYLSEQEQTELREHNQAVIELLKTNLGEELVEGYLHQVGYQP